MFFVSSEVYLNRMIFQLYYIILLPFAYNFHNDHAITNVVADFIRCITSL